MERSAQDYDKLLKRYLRLREKYSSLKTATNNTYEEVMGSYTLEEAQSGLYWIREHVNNP